MSDSSVVGPSSSLVSVDEEPPCGEVCGFDDKEEEEEEEVCESVAKAQLVHESEKELQFAVDKLKVKFADKFRSTADLEYFAMLPLSDEVKISVLKRAIEIESEVDVPR